MTVKIRYADFQQATRSRTLSAAVTSPADLAGGERRPRAIGVPTGQGIRLLGVTLSSFEAPDAAEPRQFDLLLGDPPAGTVVLGQ